MISIEWHCGSTNGSGCLRKARWMPCAGLIASDSDRQLHLHVPSEYRILAQTQRRTAGAVEMSFSWTNGRDGGTGGEDGQ